MAPGRAAGGARVGRDRNGDGGRQRRLPAVVLTGLVLIPALALAGLWQYADANVPPPTTTTTTTAAPPAAPPLETDLLSLRRHPAPLAERAAGAAEAAQRADAAQALLAPIPSGSCVRAAVGSEVIADAGSGVNPIPASNQKLLVAAVALELLGPDFRFRTEIRSPRPVAGVVPGAIYLIGGGDPVLWSADIADPLPYPAFNTTSLDALADQLVALGITRIEGDVVGDGSRYDDEFRVPEWGDAIVESDAGPYDALLVNDSLLTAANYGIDPARVGSATFLRLLQARGIAVTGSAANATTPEQDFTTLALVESRPLTDILVEMLHTSDNNTAEMLVKEIGLAAAGRGDRPTGMAAIGETLRRWGVPMDGVILHDGSGLSRQNRITCEALVAVLSDSPVAVALRELLPAAGRDGTLAEQLLGTAAEGEMVAKTGTLTDVKALSGVQPDAERQPVVFALVLNAPGIDEPAVYQPIWEALVELIASHPIEVEPEPERFAPLTAG